MENSLINPLKEAQKEYFEDYLYHANKNGLKKICRELLSENEQLKAQIEKLKEEINEMKVERKEKTQKDVIAEIVQRIECGELEE